MKKLLFFSIYLLFASLAINSQSLDAWTYIEVDDTRTKFGDFDKPDWLKYFGLDMQDFNLDGYQDILSGRYIYLNPGFDMTGNWERIDLGFNVDGMLVSDVDGDEFPDIIGQSLPDIFWFEAKDLFGKSWTAKIVGKVPPTGHKNGQGYAAADILKGGKNEILFSGDGGVYICELPQNPSYDPWVFSLIAESESEEGIGVGDLDQDGDLDICIGYVPEGEEHPTEIRWFANPGKTDRLWPSKTVGNIPNAADRLKIADLNGDGRADIAVTEELWPGENPDANLWWFENLGYDWDKHKVYTGYSLNNLDAADMDADGDIDLISNEHKGSAFPTMIFENDGEGSFSKHIIDSGKECHLGTIVADMDRDGDMDIVGHAWDNYKYLHLWRNDALSDIVSWKHISSARGELPLPNEGNEQTACLTVDIDNDGQKEFFISERTAAPALTMFKLSGSIWERYVIDNDALRIEAGSTHADIDGDGDQDIVFAGEGRSNEVWWWQNPYPNFDKATAWKRFFIKQSGANKHHDQLFGDFDGDGKQELVFWNQNAGTLFLSEIPNKLFKVNEWEFHPIYKYFMDSEMKQSGSEGYPGWKSTNEQEGLAKADIDGDGIEDIIGGGRWFKYNGKDGYTENIVDASYTFSRSAAGDFIEGGRPEIILVVGDGIAPMIMYEWTEGSWMPKTIFPEMDNGHTLDVIDFNNDGHLDIFSGEMRFGEDNPDARIRILLGDGKGGFKETVVAEGIATHESKILDLDGDGDLDVLGKPYTWKAPRLDMWFNEGIK